MTRQRRAGAGFTLIELVISLALSSFVLVGVMMLATTMVRQHYDSLRSGNVSNLMVLALDGMNRDIESASHIDPNYPTVGGGPTVAICQDWSPLLTAFGSGNIDGNVANVKTIIYCGSGVATGATSGANVGTDSGNILWRYENDGSCQLPTAITCGSAPSGSPGWQQVVSRAFWPNDPGAGYNAPIPPSHPNYFVRMQDGSGIALSYIVGHSTPSANIPHPSFLKASYTIHVARHVNATNPVGSD